MTLVLSNDDVEKILSMEDCVVVVEEAFRELGEGRAVNAMRTDVLLPCAHNEEAVYTFKTMQGGIPKFGVYAVRLNSDLWTYPTVDGKERKVRIPIPIKPYNWFCANVLLFSIDTCELLAIVHSGFMQQMRVGATGGIAAKYLAREDAQSVGIIGSGGQARSQLVAMCLVRAIARAKIYSPNREHRERFAAEMSDRLEIEVKPVDSCEECVSGVDIVDLATSSKVPVIRGDWLEEGQHVHSIQPMEIGADTYHHADLVVSNVRPYGKGDGYPYIDCFATKGIPKNRVNIPGTPHLPLDWDEIPELSELILGKVPGRSDDSQITLHLSNVGLGIQFAAVGARIYELAKKEGLGKEIPTEWFFQTLQG